MIFLKSVKTDKTSKWLMNLVDELTDESDLFSVESPCSWDMNFSCSIRIESRLLLNLNNTSYG